MPSLSRFQLLKSRKSSRGRGKCINLVFSCSTQKFDSRGRTNLTVVMVSDYCRDSYQCKFDYAVTGSREAGWFTKVYQWQYNDIRNNGLKPGFFLIEY